MIQADPIDSQLNPVSDRFDREAHTYSSRYTAASPEVHSFTIRRHRVFEILAGIRAGGKVLDIGCGPGVTVEHLVAQGHQFFGVDLSTFIQPGP